MNSNSLGIPIAIVISAIIIGGAIYFSSSSQTPQDRLTTETAGEDTPTIEPITEEDHIRGNPNAPIMLVEYSDYDCPFCRIFHDTMNRIMLEYGTDGKVAWAFRHFPIASLHPDASKIAEASECAAELGGNDAFWSFTDALNDSREITYGANGQVTAVEPTDMSRMSEFAVTAGVDQGQFELCYNSGKYSDAIAQDVNEAIAAGGTGTPYTVVLVGDQIIGTINGAQPYAQVKQNIDGLLEQIANQ